MSSAAEAREWLIALAPYIAFVFNIAYLWALRRDVGAVKVDVAEVKTQTDGINAALVASTAEASEAKGEKRGIAIGVAQADDKAGRD